MPDSLEGILRIVPGSVEHLPDSTHNSVVTGSLFVFNSSLAAILHHGIGRDPLKHSFRPRNRPFGGADIDRPECTPVWVLQRHDPSRIAALIGPQGITDQGERDVGS